MNSPIVIFVGLLALIGTGEVSTKNCLFYFVGILIRYLIFKVGTSYESTFFLIFNKKR